MTSLWRLSLNDCSPQLHNKAGKPYDARGAEGLKSLKDEQKWHSVCGKTGSIVQDERISHGLTPHIAQTGDFRDHGKLQL